MSDEKLGQLIAARLNHDYVNPLTAMSNGLELIGLDEENRDIGLEIISNSLQQALGELQYNRIAFGSYGEEERISLSDVERRMKAFIRNPDFQFSIADKKYTPLKAEAKLWFLCGLCLRSSFVMLNEIFIERDHVGWRIIGKGVEARARNGQYRAEDDWLEVGEARQSNIHFYLFHMQAEKMGYDIIRQRSADENDLIVNLWARER